MDATLFDQVPILTLHYVTSLSLIYISQPKLDAGFDFEKKQGFKHI